MNFLRILWILSSKGTYEQICGYANAPDPNEPGSLLVHFPNAPAGIMTILWKKSAEDNSK